MEVRSILRGQRSLRRGRSSHQNGIYHVTTCTANREPVFARLFFGRCVVQAMRYEDARKFTRTLAFVVMPDHLHWLLQLIGPRSLSDCMRNVKAASSRDINQQRSIPDAVWQRGFHDHAIRRDEDLLAVARYIIANPLRAGIVTRIGDYPLWDARWL